MNYFNNFFVFFLIIIPTCFCQNNSNNTFNHCPSPFFKFFKVKEVHVFKDINYDEFSEQKTYRPINIFYHYIGLISIERRGVNLKIYDTKNHREHNFSVHLPDLSGEDISSYSFSFGFNLKYLVFCIKGNIYIGKLIHKAVKLKKIHQLDNTPDFVKVFDNKAILSYFGCRFNNQGFKANTHFYVLNFNDFSCKFINLATPQSFYFTLFYPPEVVDFSSKFIAHSDITPYKIKIYDISGSLLYEIYKRDSLFKEIDVNLHNKFSDLIKQNSKTVKPVIDSIRNIFFGGFGIIEKVSFVNDSVLLFRWYGPKNDTSDFYPSIYLDLWLIKSNSFFPIAKNVRVEKFVDTIPRICQTLLSSRYETGSNYLIKFFGIFSDEVGNLYEPIKKYLEREEKNLEKPQKLIIWLYEYK